MLYSVSRCLIDTIYTASASTEAPPRPRAGCVSLAERTFLVEVHTFPPAECEFPSGESAFPATAEGAPCTEERHPPRIPWDGSQEGMQYQYRKGKYYPRARPHYP